VLVTPVIGGSLNETALGNSVFLPAFKELLQEYPHARIAPI
jgi:hypothetical protein